MISILLNSPVSNLTTTNNIDNDIKNDDNSQSFATIRKHSHIPNKLSDTNTPNTQVQLKLHPIPC